MYQSLDPDDEEAAMMEGTELSHLGAQPSGASMGGLPSQPTMQDERSNSLAPSVGEWSIGLCEWYKHMDYCLYILCVPCVRLGLTAHRARLDSNINFYTVFGVFCVLYFIAGLPGNGPHRPPGVDAHFIIVGNKIVEEPGDFDGGYDGWPDEEQAAPGFAWYLTRLTLFIIVMLRVMLRWRLREKYNIEVVSEMKPWRPVAAGKQRCGLPHSELLRTVAMTQEAVHVDLIEEGVTNGLDITIQQFNTMPSRFN
eukprot:CAMPEP_0175981472 /NCGR_PEP_ID=MMETSP0108-20121206/47359_1 /TAXON_ID=195067 ORGANISM="Goniomonas pacifica, Strain CCMP1869" /NCGR_SAMPLE_ID=MMETSP0108 /ASSEMBLY_ACC=CAM_ASM_000204 /LENGTH=252 /DNA_ID=CAMNT_0017312015 /DNA_START=42 /DNA_END=802 /DNA_ORIENTATION=+